MNINDIKEETIIPEEIWKAIFEQQLSLALKYSDIEKMGSLLQTTDTNLDTREGQKWIKDFAWRVTEEIAEASEAYLDAKKFAENENVYIAETEQFVHHQEEVIDALHFLVELSIIAGYNHTIVPEVKIDKPMTAEMWDVVYYLGLACNCLKNKPWKQTQMLTDRPKFEKLLKEVWISLILVMRGFNWSDKEVYLFYSKKKEVNKFRIRSKY